MDTFKLYLAGKIVDVKEAKMTPDQMKKREKIAKSIERDNPDMPMDKKMAIATKSAMGEGKMKDISMDAELMKLYTKAMKTMPGSPAQKKIIDQINKRRKRLGMKEDLDEVVQFAPAAMAVGNAAVRMAPAAGAAVQTVKKVFKKFTSKKEAVITEMDPADHVKEKDGKFCVYNADGSIAKEFDNKKDAVQYAKDNHDKLMATKKEAMGARMHRMKMLDKMKKASPRAKAALSKPSKDSKKTNEAFKVKDTVIPKVGPHKGVKHEIIHDFKDGTYNIKPIGLSSRQIKYRMGAAKAKKTDLKSVKEAVEVNERNYRKEYDNYQGRPEQIANRSSRNSARRIMGDKAVKGMDVGHKDNNPLNNDPKNLQMEDPSENRREPRTREVEEKATGKRMRNWHKDYDFDQDRDIVKGFVSPKARSLAKKMVKDVVPMVKATKTIRSKFPGMKLDAISDLLKKEGLPQAIKAKDSARRKEYNAFQKARRK